MIRCNCRRKSKAARVQNFQSGSPALPAGAYGSGVVAAGSLQPGSSHPVKYEAAWFTGKIAGEHAKAFVARISYEF